VKKTIQVTNGGIASPNKKFKNIKVGSLVIIKFSERRTKYQQKSIYAIKGLDFTDENTVIPNNSVGIVVGYKYRRMNHKLFLKNEKKKKITLITKWFQVLIDHHVFLILDCDVYPAPLKKKK
jgi:hypothetical protein